ncbi:MAG: tetratricopeptide repeat protein [Pseudonocardiaceae bacterium]
MAVVRSAVFNGLSTDKPAGSDLTWRQIGQLLCGLEDLPARADGQPHNYNDYVREVIQRAGLTTMPDRTFRHKISGPFRRMLAGILIQMANGELPFQLIDEVEISDQGSVRDNVPRDLIADIKDFVGQTDYIESLDQWLSTVDPHPHAVIAVISGAPGVGKTALAVRWGHQVREHFPDGDLYIDLRGYSPDVPIEPHDAIGVLLRRLGVSPQEVPQAANERASLYRTVLHDKKVLIILDNVATAQQIELLLPGSRSCVVVVTSRDNLPALRELHDTHHIILEPLPVNDAIQLLHLLVGSRVAEEPTAARIIAEACARLPLVLRIAAGVIVDLPQTTLGELAHELSSAATLLDAADEADDERISIRAVLSWSYRSLTEQAAQLFRLLDSIPAEEVTVYAVSAALNVGQEIGARVLRRLRRAHLIEEPKPGRFKMHDLIRAYAAEVAAVTDSRENLDAASIRVVDYYLYTANDAMNSMYPHERERRPIIAPISTPTPDFNEPSDARRWVDTERANLLLVALWAKDVADYGINYSRVLHRDLEVTGFYEEGVTLHTIARTNAQRIGDPIAEGSAYTRLGVMQWRMDSYDEAEGSFTSAIEVTTGLDAEEAPHIQLAATGNFALVHALKEEWPPAILLFERALEISRDIGNPAQIAFSLTNLGMCNNERGTYSAALPFFHESLTYHKRCGNRNGIAITLDGLGECYSNLGRIRAAKASLLRAIDIHTSVGDREGEARASHNLARVLMHEDPKEALRRVERAIQISQVLKITHLQVRSMTTQAELLTSHNNYDLAIDVVDKTAKLAARLPGNMTRAKVMRVYGDALALAKHPAEAVEKWNHAMMLCASVYTADADKLRGILANRLDNRDV